ncbi:Zn(2)-C6 fungal-type DNA-binding domain [Colletotrichum camelliae]|nr:Zn(2)-C6 fungal-type DNA-binding domain [Colletotrichum camelliae]
MEQPQPSTPARPPPVGRFYKSRKSRPSGGKEKEESVVACRGRSIAFKDFPIPDFFNLTENDLLAGNIEQLHDPALLAVNHVASAGTETPSQTSSHDNDSSQASPQSNHGLAQAWEAQRGALNHSAVLTENRPLHRSLEAIPGAFSFFIGPTGAADIHLLNREQYDAHDVARPRLSGLQYRRLKQGASQKSPVIFGITDQELLANAEPKVESSIIDGAWAELWSIVDPQTAWRLIQLYGRFVDPCFPVVAIQQLPSGPEELSNVSLGLLAALCASALPFIMHDESLYGLLLHPPSSQRLYRLSRDGEDEMYGIGAVYLCYIITHMALFRALLRPLDRWPTIALQSPLEAEGLFTAAKAVIKGSILCVKEFVEMLENMTGSQWNGFWHSWSRQNFAIGGSFMVHLLHITSASNAVRFSVGDDGDLGFDDEDKELRAWITRWRSATRASATGAAGAKGLANLGLLRVETMLGRLLASEANNLS